MQRKALKQVTQWTNEKVFSGEKTSLSDDFVDFEKEVDVRRIGIERLHATSIPFFQQVTKVKPSPDPYPPSGSNKDKILHTEALGLVMIDFGGDVGGVYGDGLGKYGKARCRLAMAQEDFGRRLGEGYIGGMETALAAVNDYKTFRKKLDSRRLALDSAISKVQNSKKESRAAEFDVDVARERFEEIEEETKARLAVIQEQEEQQWSDLTDMLDAEYEYFSSCKEILEELRNAWPTGEVSRTANRPRAKSNASARSLNRQATTRNMAKASDEEDDITPNRSRSQSNASSNGGKSRFSMPSFGLGKKSLGGGGGKRKTFGKERYEDDSRQALNSDDDDDFRSTNSRNRSQTTLSASRVSLASDSYAAPPPFRRTQTMPMRSDANTVKAIYDFPGGAADELTMRAGDVIEIKRKISEDWWIGEIGGRSGMFPASYVEDYVPSPTTAKPVNRAMPPLPGAGRNGTRTMPPALSTSAPNDAIPARMSEDRWGGMTSESDFDNHDFSDSEHNITASLTAEPQAPSSYRSPIAAPMRKPAPPPPPSRRSQSSSNLLSASAGGRMLSPPQPAFARTQASSSNEGSPFAGSEEDDDYEEEEEIFGGGRARSGTVGSTPHNSGGLATGLGNMHLGQTGGHAPDCQICGCDDFTQNVFKAKGVCSTCYHSH